MAEFIDEVQADLVRLRKVAGKKEFDKLEEAWLEAIARPDLVQDDAQGEPRVAGLRPKITTVAKGSGRPYRSSLTPTAGARPKAGQP